MLTVGGVRKQFCVGCGGPRDPEYAQRVACFCCGALGTQRTAPQFDEHGEPVAPKARPVEPSPAPEPTATVAERKQRAVATLAALFV